MVDYLCISVTHLDALFHGKADRDEPEWPPSPLRLFQALLRGARTGCRDSEWTEAKAAAFEWLEQCKPPLIVTSKVSRASEYTLYVPNNDSDKEIERQNRLTSKVVRPHRLPEEIELRRLHYLWRIDKRTDSSAFSHTQTLCNEARHMLALGWGIDQATADGRILSDDEAGELLKKGIEWKAFIGQHQATDALRVPIKGTLRDLENVYQSFLNSANNEMYAPPLKPSVFDWVSYISPTFVPSPLYALFELRHSNNDFCRYPVAKLSHIAGMVRHLAIE